MEEAVEKLRSGCLFRRALNLYNEDEDIIFITSDHGNIEDLTVNTHTFNKVPTVILGKIPENVEIEINSLTDIMRQYKNF